MKQNTEPNEFNGESKTGRFWLGAYHMMEAKINEAITNSQIKRGEREPLSGKWKFHAWGCGCCVHVSEYPKEENFAFSEAARINRIYSKKKRRGYTFHEIGGRRISRIELPNGSQIEV